MGKKLPYTPNSRINAALRTIWMRSRERSQAIKSTNGCCAICGVKQTAAKGREVKLVVHHAKHRPDWQKIYKVIRKELLRSDEVDDLWPLCLEDHKNLHAAENNGVPQEEYVKARLEAMK